MDAAGLKFNGQVELVNNAKELYNSINECIDKIVLSRLHQDVKAEERAVFQAETLLCQVQQYLSNIIDYLPIETKYKIGDKVLTKFGCEDILCKIDDILIVEDDEVLKVVYSVSDLDERMFGTRFTNELVKYLEE
jgi:hypothetical protein